MINVDFGMLPDLAGPCWKIYMKEALEQVVELFRAKDWKFEVDEENDAVRTGIEADNGHWQVRAVASDGRLLKK